MQCNAARENTIHPSVSILALWVACGETVRTHASRGSYVFGKTRQTSCNSGQHFYFFAEMRATTRTKRTSISEPANNGNFGGTAR